MTLETNEDLGIEDLTIFSRDGLVGITRARLVDITGVRDGEPAVIIYGHCAAGNNCNGIHGVAFEPKTFLNLLKEYQEKYYPKTRLDTQ